MIPFPSILCAGKGDAINATGLQQSSTSREDATMHVSLMTINPQIFMIMLFHPEKKATIYTSI